MLSFQILGDPGCDNAVHVRIDSGQSLERILFDCGEGCLQQLHDDVRETDLLVFSHFHMDHVSGFDSFFRVNFDRTAKPVRVIGPQGTIAIMEHRLRGWLWNLHSEMSGTWEISEWDGTAVSRARLELSEAFAVTHEQPSLAAGNLLYQGEGYTLQGILLEHHGPVLGCIIRERPRWNLDSGRLEAMGLRPGPWIRLMKEAPQDSLLEFEGNTRTAAEWRAMLMTETAGESLAVLTDFRLGAETLERLAVELKHVKTIICESQYLPADAALAEEYHHMTCTQAASIAARAGAGQLFLYHVSSRYREPEWKQMLREACRVFPDSHFPPHWECQPGVDSPGHKLAESV